jgi:hypothetical protein
VTADKPRRGGGRTHGLSAKGVSKPKQVRLGDAATARLKVLMAETGLTASEIVRNMLLHPDGLTHAFGSKTSNTEVQR